MFLASCYSTIIPNIEITGGLQKRGGLGSRMWSPVAFQLLFLHPWMCTQRVQVPKYSSIRPETLQLWSTWHGGKRPERKKTEKEKKTRYSYNGFWGPIPSYVGTWGPFGLRNLDSKQPCPCASELSEGCLKGPKDHINIRISHSGSKAQYEGATRSHGL